MTEPKPSRNRRKAWMWYVVATLLSLPVLYVFSVGPVNRLVTKGYISRSAVYNWVAPFYRPIDYGRERWETFDEFIEWIEDSW